MKLNPSLSKLLFLPVLVILFSLGFFSFKSHAEVFESFPVTYATSDLFTYDWVCLDSTSNDSFLFGFTYVWTEHNRACPVLVFDKPVEPVLTYSGGYTLSKEVISTTTSNITRDSQTYYFYQFTSAEVTKVDRENVIFSLVYYSFDSALDDYLNSQGPDFADFGLKDFEYITSFNNAIIGLMTLKYTCYWSGSTNPDFPLTNVDFKIYGFYHKDTDVTDFDNPYNAALLGSGSGIHSSITFDLMQWINSMQGTDHPYEKFVIYIIPFSNNTEGNTSFIEADLYKSTFNLEFGPISFSDDGGFLIGLDASFTDGVIPVTPTDSIDGVGVNYIDGVPVVGTVNNISGSFNREFNIYKTTNNYNPVIYVSNDNSVNDYRDMSEHITNNNTYNFNFTGKFDTSNDDASVSGIVSFLTAIVTFFNTFWSYVIVCLNWLPSWCIVFVTTVFGTVASVIIALGIFKLFRG